MRSDPYPASGDVVSGTTTLGTTAAPAFRLTIELPRIDRRRLSAALDRWMTYGLAAYGLAAGAWDLWKDRR